MGRDQELDIVGGSGLPLTRRRILQSAGIALAATAFPAPSNLAAQTTTGSTGSAISDVMARLSGYMSEARTRALPDEVVAKAKEHIIDTLAAMVSGSELLPGKAAIKFARVYGGQKVSTVVGSTVLCGPIEAALANGVMAHADETDDSWFQQGWHPGANVVPAALATGERFGITGTEFLRAVVLGYDVGARVVMTLRPSLLEPHSMVGTFAAAAAAGSAAKLTAQQMRWLLDYAAQQASGYQAWGRDVDHIEKGFVFGGMPARNGVTSAVLVHAGWNGIDDGLSGEGNFILMCAPKADPAGLVDQLGARYDVTRTNMKKWSVGTPIQAPLDALEIISKRRAFTADDVKEVTVRMAAASVVDNRDMPDINIQYMIAVMLVDKTATFKSAHDKARMQDPTILRHRAKVKLVVPPGMSAASFSRAAFVTVVLNDGTELSENVEAVLGTLTNPMSREQLEAKCRDLMAPVVGTDRCNRLIETIFTIEKMNDVRGLRPLLQQREAATRTSRSR